MNDIPAVKYLMEAGHIELRSPVTFFIGENGTGKSTLLRMVNGLERPSSGKVIVNGHDVGAASDASLRAIRREDPNGEWLKRYKLHDLQALFLAGERADPDTVEWAQKHLGVPVVDHWWQTETGWAIAANPIGIEVLLLAFILRSAWTWTRTPAVPTGPATAGLRQDVRP